MTFTRPVPLALGAALCASALLAGCSLGVGTPGASGIVQSGAAEVSAMSGAQSGAVASAQSATNDAVDEGGATPAPPPEPEKPEDLTKVLATWSGPVRNTVLRIDINQVQVEDGVTTVTMSVINTGHERLDNWMGEFGGPQWLSDHIRLIDTKNQLVYLPGKLAAARQSGGSGAAGGDANSAGGQTLCLCTAYTNAGLDPEQATLVYTTFKGLPEDVAAVNIDLRGPSQIIEGVPVSRE